MRSWLIFILSAFLYSTSTSALPSHRPDYNDDTSRSSQKARTVSKELFSSLEELSRIVDITYCVGTTGVYKPFTCAGRCHEFEGFELVTTWNTGPFLSDSCGFVVLSHPPWPKRIIIGFRGTYSIANTIVDLSAIPQIYTPYPANNPTDPHQPRCNNCTVHAGFMESWKSARRTLLDPLKRTMVKYPDYQLVLVGHSLGGAVAALAGLEFQVRGWQPQVTTFGEPRVGNQGLVEYIDAVFHLKNSSLSSSGYDRATNGDIKRNTKNYHNKTSSYHRVTHVNDPVPLLPLSEWGYRPHAGEIYILKPDLPPDISDLQHCIGDADPECIAGSEAAGKSYLLALTLSSSSASSAGRIGAYDYAYIEEDNDVTMDTAVSISQQRQHHQQPLLPSGPNPIGDRMLVRVQSDGNDVKRDLTQWNLIPHRYRLWELLFAHRDYFWRLGVCLPSPNWSGKRPGDHGGWKLPWKWKWKWKWKWPWKSWRGESRCDGAASGLS
ncbi:triacylglycerol lipase [Blastomyces gilchristii SLH14081]|uniref:Triacylglycerol lipase n=1 Tax=Blastomyces gilchristii (strain SLH14081) TaxID=559298 RepID=A0A179UFN1_BLAGS|nr:triacylglycerol lipase [Blastomyces gilchristii SLH14081]OAT05322.1 triacylglycerol lipase [Blastomyces gilchristii SLH14081]